MRQLNFEQLNEGWNAEPNVPDVLISVIEHNIIVQFYLNAFAFPAFSEGDTAKLTFHNCLKYRLGPPNDEGFYRFGQSRFKKYGVKWGEFYLVNDSDWQECFPDAIEVSNQRTENLQHFLFYFRDDTFECIAGSYTLEFYQTK